MRATTSIRRLLLLGTLLLATAAQAAEVLFLTTGNVPQGKFRLLADIARPLGIAVDVRYTEKLPADSGPGLFKPYDLVFIDTYQQDSVRQKLAAALPGLTMPHAWLYEDKPEWGGLPEPLARRLLAYYANGSRANFENFFRTLAAHLAGQPTSDIPAPIVFPKAAVYHPQAPGLVFADTADYLRWKGADALQPPLTVAIVMHQQYIAAEQTAFVDDLIARIEAAGALPVAVYVPTMDNGGIRRLLAPGGRPVADVLINTQIMLNAEGRRSEFEALDLPVIQAMPYRRGDAAAWAADPQGVAPMDVPFYLAQAEYAGVTDIQIAAATDRASDRVSAIAAQAAAVVAKALKLGQLRRKSNGAKKVAFMFWNYPPGEKNLGASYMNLPTSLEATLAAMKASGYDTETPTAAQLTAGMQRLLAPFYRNPGDDRALEALLRDGLAELLPLRAYREWLDSLPPPVRDRLLADMGAPEASTMLVRREGALHFAVPRLVLGNVTILPQPPRTERGADREKALYHSATAAPTHFYLAAYLWLRRQFGADALVHYGTHGTQEWLPGKERGLSVYDYPMLALGDVPVIYPYIVDNIGEAVQTKRRGRAVNVSYQTPPFAPAGLHASLTRIHDLLHDWLAQDEGAVRQRIAADFLARVRSERIDRDLGWTAARIASDFPAFVNAVHEHLHELARNVQPMGLHTFGRGADEKWRLATVLMMLGKPFWEASAGANGNAAEEAEEVLVGDYARLPETSPYLLLRRHLVEGVPASGLPPALQAQLEQGRRWYADLGAANEIVALLAALDGRYIPTSYGGDPVKNPDALPTGRNLYGFDPSRVPTRAAWEAGKEAMDKLIAAHRDQTGRAPKKLAFTLWSVETMRHQGMLEAQALWALGVEPVWDAGGRVSDVRLVPRDALGRPRVDVVLSATGLYRDHFPNALRILARAAALAAQAGEADNPVAANARAVAARLEAQGWSGEAARKAAQTRIFSSASGRYGTGLDAAALATDTWRSKAEADRKLARLYLSRMQYAYGPDEADWGESGEELAALAGAPGRGAAEKVNLYAAHLTGTEGAVLSRTSNLYGMLTTDDPFQYLGGIALAVRHLDGKAPELYISNLRGAGSGKVESAARSLAMELATRNFHPGYIKGVMAEGYAGTLQVLDSINNFAGWTSVAPEIVRDDQWQEFAEVYVRDKHGLGLAQWFERHNPHALAQSIERMLEAARQNYWQADAATLAELKKRYRDLARRYDVSTDNAELRQFVGIDGFGLGAARARAPAPLALPSAPPVAVPAPPPTVTGMQLQPVAPRVVRTLTALLAVSLGMLLLLPLAGAWRQFARAPA